jgi:hypothetical protein
VQVAFEAEPGAPGTGTSANTADAGQVPSSRASSTLRGSAAWLPIATESFASRSRKPAASASAVNPSRVKRKGPLAPVKCRP